MKIRVKTFEDLSDEKLGEQLNKIGYQNVQDILFSIDSFESGYYEIVKVIYLG